MPFGKWKGVRLRLVDTDYLSWLTTAEMMQAPQWDWLKQSLLAELRFRGLRADLADTQDFVCDHQYCDLAPEECPCNCHKPAAARAPAAATQEELPLGQQPEPNRGYRLDG